MSGKLKVVTYEAILFDFDGVIVDSEPIHWECWQEVLREYDMQLDWETYQREGIGVSDRDMLRNLCALRVPPLDLDVLVSHFPRKKEMFRARMMAAPPVSPEVIELLASLGDYKVGLVTSSGRVEVEEILNRAGIREHFQTAVFGGDVKRLKPAPDPYLLAVERLGVVKALVVEDSDAGCASATAAGLDVLRVNNQAEMPALLMARLSAAVIAATAIPANTSTR